MQYLTEDDILAVYRETIGEPIVRNAGGLASAVGRPQQSAFGEDAYPSIFSKTAALMHSLAENQPFVDGNKRIAWISGKLFLQLHGLTMRASEEEGLALFAGVALGMTVHELAAWIESHAQSIVDEENIA